MKAVLPLLLVLTALAGCRDEDPDQAPPIGAAPVAVAADERAVTPAPSDFRAATADALAAFDAAWLQCGDDPGDAATRCRDEAAIAYDAAMTDARARFVDDGIESGAGVTGVLERHDDLAAVQVTGTRG